MHSCVDGLSHKFWIFPPIFSTTGWETRPLSAEDWITCGHFSSNFCPNENWWPAIRKNILNVRAQNGSLKMGPHFSLILQLSSVPFYSSSIAGWKVGKWTRAYFSDFYSLFFNSFISPDHAAGVVCNQLFSGKKSTAVSLDRILNGSDHRNFVDSLSRWGKSERFNSGKGARQKIRQVHCQTGSD